MNFFRNRAVTDGTTQRVADVINNEKEAERRWWQTEKERQSERERHRERESKGLCFCRGFLSAVRRRIGFHGRIPLLLLLRLLILLLILPRSYSTTAAAQFHLLHLVSPDLCGSSAAGIYPLGRKGQTLGMLAGRQECRQAASLWHRGSLDSRLTTRSTNDSRQLLLASPTERRLLTLFKCCLCNGRIFRAFSSERIRGHKNIRDIHMNI